MRGSSVNQSDQTNWISFLIRSVDEVELPALRDRARGAGLADAAASRSQSTSGRLLALYIARARDRQSSDCQRARAAAGAELDTIHSRIEGRLNARADAQPCARENATQTATQTATQAATRAVAETATDQTPVVAPPAEPSAEPPAEPPAGDPDLAEAVRLTYRMVLRRNAAEAEVRIWLQNFHNGMAFHDFLLLIHAGDEARALREGETVGAGASDGDFIVDLFRVIRGRGCSAHEVDLLRARLEAGAITRQGLLTEAFTEIAAQARANGEPQLHDGLSAAIMGTGKTVTLEDWQNKAGDSAALARARAALAPATPFVWPSEPGLRVSAIASLYCGGDFIDQFMDNITGQTGFDRHCELIIIDAESPENEGETIARYLDRHPSIVYRRMNSRVGIYEAWNIGVEIARGRYLTNTNLDDLRREDSLEIQAGALDAMGFADVVYQDFYTSFDPSLSWEEVAAFGYKSDLPMLTPHNMLHFNSPHNAPMWRKSLHDELGLFDAGFKSAGDFEFWMRCLAAGKKFCKVNEPHVIYYQNPQGLSTRADSRGLTESHAITRKYGPPLMARAMTCDYDAFRQDVGAPAPRADRNRYVTAQAGLRGLAQRFKPGMS